MVTIIKQVFTNRSTMRYAQPSPFPFILTLILITMFSVTAVNTTYELGI